MIDLVWLIPFFPLIGCIFNGLFGYRLPKGIVGLIASASVGLSFIVSVLIFFELLKFPAESRSINVILYNWILSGGLYVPIGFLVDPLSVVMMMTVAGVSCIIHVYSIGYMHEEKGFFKYFTYLNLFVFSMLILVSANNFLLMFVGWEGVGLCSYLLIGYFHERKEASDAGKKAFIVNRVGDFGFLLGILLIYTTFQTLQFTDPQGAGVFDSAHQVLQSGGSLITAITLLLFVGAIGKSAQIPLYTWLPDAMEGPTPVSALIHAATMVTAGVYMVARCNVLYLMAPISLGVVAVVGALTAIYAASIGLTQFDIKRVLAYSTISQLGYMFLACGVGAFAAGIFHLMTHAFFKALLFLGAGSVMHALAGELDMRKMGNLRRIMPYTYATYVIATLAIAGIFPFAGFFSKDEILFRVFSAGFLGKILWVVGASAAFMTSFYMFRTVYMTFHGKSRMDPDLERHAHESPAMMIIPLVLLASLSIVGGFVGIPVIEGGNQFGRFLEPVMKGQILGAESSQGLAFAAETLAYGADAAHSVGLELLMMAISMAIAIVGWMLARKMYIIDPSLPQKVAKAFGGFYTLIYNKYKIDELYNAMAVSPIVKASGWLWTVFDDIFIDRWMVNGTARLMGLAGGVLKYFQTGYVQNYALAILLGVLFVIGYMVFKG